MSQTETPAPEGRSTGNLKSWSAAVRELHGLYCQWPAQPLSLRFDRERLWYEFLLTPIPRNNVAPYSECVRRIFVSSRRVRRGTV